MTEKEKKLELLKSQYARGFLSSGEYEKEKRKVLEEVDWGAFFNIKKTSLTAAVLLICGIGFYVSALVDWRSVFSTNPNNNINPHNNIKPPNTIKQANLDDLVSEMCNCYDNAVLESPSQEPKCAKLKAKIHQRITIDSLEAKKFDSLVTYCPNYPICANLQQELQELRNDSTTAYSRKTEARNWQLLRTPSERYRDIKDADEDYEKIQTQIHTIERRITINCNND